MKTETTFPSNGLALAGHLHLPDDYTGDSPRAGIVVSHPFGGVKEQTAGLYAQRLAGAGFVALAFDASYQGQSEGQPRFLENPFARAEDIKNAVTFLTTRDEVDSDRIGALGICASGGYVPYAAQTEHRIKAVATVSALDIGSMFREGLGGGQSEDVVRGMLDQAGKDRTAEALGKEPHLEHIVPESEQAAAQASSTLDREAHDYYRTPRGQHPNAPNWWLFRSIDQIAQYSSYDRIHLISPRPLLMIAGTEADTAYFSRRAIDKAGAPKELFWIDDATHVDLYDKDAYIPAATAKLTAFFDKHVAAR